MLNNSVNAVNNVIHEFTSNGTLTIPSWANIVTIEGIGSGGGGGSGRVGASSSARYGGGGGQGGNYHKTSYSASLLKNIGNILNISIGKGGVGGASQSASNTSGTDGNAGSDTTVDINGSYIFFLRGGNGGLRGASGTVGLGGASNDRLYFSGGAGGQGQSQSGFSSGYGAGGGGGGGWINTSNTPAAGGNGGIGSVANNNNLPAATGGAVATSGVNGKVVATHSIMNYSQLSGYNTSSDANYELGMRFQSSIAGYVKGVVFYKPSGVSGIHIGKLWNSSGTLLKSAVFSNETASGWQTVLFNTPVPISANTTYIVSVNTNNSIYYYYLSGFLTPTTIGYLTTIDSNNGVFSTTPGSYPGNISSSSTNYFRDVLFAPSISTFRVAGAGGSGSGASNTGNPTLSGGNGSYPGGGGGGGGGSLNNNSSGAGGNGADGIVWISFK